MAPLASAIFTPAQAGFPLYTRAIELAALVSARQTKYTTFMTRQHRPHPLSGLQSTAVEENHVKLRSELHIRAASVTRLRVCVNN